MGGAAVVVGIRGRIDTGGRERERAVLEVAAASQLGRVRLEPRRQGGGVREDGPDVVDGEAGRPQDADLCGRCLLYTSPSPRDISGARMPSSA